VSAEGNKNVTAALTLLGAFVNGDGPLMRQVLDDHSKEETTSGLIAVATSAMLEVTRLLSGKPQGTMDDVRAMMDHLLLADMTSPEVVE